MPERGFPDLLAALAQIVDRIAGVLDPVEPGSEPVRMYLAGGVALNLYCGTRYTEDVDAFFSRRILLPPDLAVAYRRADGTTAVLYFDTQYSPFLGLIHARAADDAPPWPLPSPGAPRIRLHVLAPIDLAVTKIGRLSDQDHQDILALARARLLPADRLRQRAFEALADYVGGVASVRANIDAVVEQVRIQTPR